MAELDNNTQSFTIKDLFRLVGVLMLLLIWAFVWIFFANPIHDFGLWTLEKSFAYANIGHPDGSILLEKKTYLGGEYTHGNSNCVYAVGEMREASQTRDEIKNIYIEKRDNFGGMRLPLRVIFEDEYDGPSEMPAWSWQDEIWEVPQSTNTFYIVYVSIKFPSLFDFRCDDGGPYSYILPL